MKFYLAAMIVCSAISVSCSKSVATNQPANKPAAAISESKYDPTPKPLEGARINLADAKKAFDDGDALFVDVRGADAFVNEHVKGAVNITIGDIDANIPKLPSDKKLIVYCSCGAEHSSIAWVAKAKEKGIDNAYALLGGTQAWVDAGYPIEKK